MATNSRTQAKKWPFLGTGMAKSSSRGLPPPTGALGPAITISSNEGVGYLDQKCGQDHEKAISCHFGPSWTENRPLDFTLKGSPKGCPNPGIGQNQTLFFGTATKTKKYDVFGPCLDRPT